MLSDKIIIIFFMILYLHRFHKNIIIKIKVINNMK
jgi:hypothetical protein